MVRTNRPRTKELRVAETRAVTTRVAEARILVMTTRVALTLLLIKYISEEFAKSRLIPYLCCQKEESADRKGKLEQGLQSLESMNRLSPSCLVAKSR